MNFRTNPELTCIAVRVALTCIVFAYVVFVPLKSRYKHSALTTWLLVSLLVFITVSVTILFLSTGIYLNRYSTHGILLWIALAVMVFQISVRCSCLETLFLVLVILNLYVNIMAVAKVMGDVLCMPFPAEATKLLCATLVLIVYTPLLQSLFLNLYRRVIELNVLTYFWRYIWAIPALVYMIFYVKFISDYWKNPVQTGTEDVIFTILWSFMTYALFWVTLQMIIQTHEGISAEEQTRLIASQLRMQEAQYRKLLENLENTRRLRHDWRHHLLILSGLCENGEIGELKRYLEGLIPAYETGREISLCRNHVVDILLQHYAGIAKNNGIETEIRANIDREPGISDTDLCIIFGNLLENASDACISRGVGRRYIGVRADMKNRQMTLMIKNTYGNTISQRGGMFCSTKHAGAGVGLASVKKVSEKYGGLMKTEYDGEYFTVYVILNSRRE